MSAAVMFEKSPNDVADLVFDFTDLLATAEELTGTPTVTIVAILPGTGTITPNGVCTLQATANKKCVQQVDGGTVGEQYRITVAVVTDTGSPSAHEYHRDFILSVRNL